MCTDSMAKYSPTFGAVKALLVVSITEHRDNIALGCLATNTTPTDKQMLVVISTVVSTILCVETVHCQRLLTFCTSTINT